MGYTIEDMLVSGKDRYKIELKAGRNGWSNSISWLLMVEDMTILQHFSGKELAVTTGLGFQTEEALMALVRSLHERSAAGLLVNTGYYVKEIPASVLSFCDKNDLPLLIVPWEIYLGDLIKDASIRIFLTSEADEQISAALIRAIEQPQDRKKYEPELRAYFDLDGTFQVALVTTEGLDRMDTVERRRLAYRMQIFLGGLTHNGHFFYYDSCFVIIMNALTQAQCREILEEFAERVRKRMYDKPVYIGVSDPVTDIGNLRKAYRRARAAAGMAQAQKITPVYFGDMGVYRLLYMVDDMELLKSFCYETLGPVLEYDAAHGTEYMKTLEAFLNCEGSIKAVSEQLYVHRNTILYRVQAIKKLLPISLDDPQNHLTLRIACMLQSVLSGRSTLSP